MQKIVTGESRIGFYVWRNQPDKAWSILLRYLKNDIKNNCGPDEVVADLKVVFNFVLKGSYFPAKYHYDLAVDCLELAQEELPLIKHWGVWVRRTVQPDVPISHVLIQYRMVISDPLAPGIAE